MTAHTATGPPALDVHRRADLVGPRAGTAAAGTRGNRRHADLPGHHGGAVRVRLRQRDPGAGPPRLPRVPHAGPVLDGDLHGGAGGHGADGRRRLPRRDGPVPVHADGAVGGAVRPRCWWRSSRCRSVPTSAGDGEGPGRWVGPPARASVRPEGAAYRIVPDGTSEALSRARAIRASPVSPQSPIHDARSTSPAPHQCPAPLAHGSPGKAARHRSEDPGPPLRRAYHHPARALASRVRPSLTARR